MNDCYKHEKDHIYYSDLYDRHTVMIGRLMDKDLKRRENEPLKLFKARKAIHDLCMYFWKGEEYAKKDKQIQAWISEDRRKDELLENSEPLKNIHCLCCNKIMKCFDKSLRERYGHEYVFFMYSCPDCNSCRAFYNDGTEYRVKPTKCKKCGSENVKKSTKKIKGELTVYTKCNKCKYLDVYTFENAKEKKDPDFASDRDKYCLTSEEGQEYIQSNRAVKEMNEIWEKQKKKRSKR